MGYHGRFEKNLPKPKKRKGKALLIVLLVLLLLIGAAAQIGIFGAYVVALHLGFTPAEAGAIGIIGGADGPTAMKRMLT